MVQFLKSIQTQLANAESVQRAMTTQSEAALDGLMAEFEAAEIALDRATLAETLGAFGQLLAHHKKRLQAAESRVVEELADDKPLMDARDTHAQQLGTAVSQARTFLSQHGEPSVLRAYGMAATPPLGNPAALEVYASEATRLLRAKPHAFDAFGVSITTGGLADSIDAPLERLRMSLAEIQREQRELDLARADRNTTRAAFERVYTATVSVFTAFLGLAGHGALADRLQPTARRVRGDARVSLDGDAPADDAEPRANGEG